MACSWFTVKNAVDPPDNVYLTQSPFKGVIIIVRHAIELNINT